ncbi:DUF4198 domain-containing protein [Chromatiaceae bacterium AAb-1]|nr:DUF4198 domain-containing protein [Chromatiaceae bacterium AAb-1]
MKKTLLTSMWLTLFSSGSALAHIPYLAPSTFEPVRGGWVALDAAFADKFFIPEAVFDNSQFVVVSPDGLRKPLEQVFYSKIRATADYQLSAEGTYRFSTGRRFGAVFRTYELDGKRHSLRDPEAELPAGAKPIAHFQAVTHAETYVSKGAPDTAALVPHNEGLEFQFISHPNDLYADSAVRLRVLFDGKPLADQNISVYRVAKETDDENATYTLKSDKKGEVSFKPELAGSYLLLSRYRKAAPENAGVPEYSHSYTVVVDVTP